MNFDGFNFGVNFGRVVGVGIDDYVYFYIVLCWNGDINFMLVIVDMKVILEFL